MKPDFGGYATKANLRCSDGRTILPDAFKHMDGMKVPLVWQHAHGEPTNVLGHALLEARDGSMYCHGFFNETDAGKHAKNLVAHGDINALSIYANKLDEHNRAVKHGQIREVSLVLAGANPGALIDNVNIAHGDGSITTLDDDVLIYTDETIELTHSEEDNMTIAHADDEDLTVQDVFETMNEQQQEVVHFLVGEALAGAGASASHAAGDEEDDSEDDGKDKTVKEIFDSMTEEQQNVVFFMVGQAVQEAEKASANKSSDTESGDDKTAKHADTLSEGSNIMSHNVFERAALSADDTNGKALSHSEIVEATSSIFSAAARTGSIKEAAEEYALKHGIEDIDVLFPDAKAVTATPEFIKRRTEWVSEVMSGSRHTPFSRIKSLTANLTFDDARAKGYVKGNMKKEEFFRVAKRVTTPQTVYKKQKLDRDDVLDITDFDVVAWLKGEMRLMLDEEIARAVLIGDGRSAEDEDKISEEHIRPIANDSDLFVTYVNVDLSGGTADKIVDALTLQRRHYRGSGNPTFFTSETILAQMLLHKDSLGRRIYATTADLAAALRVSKIVTVEIMDQPSVDVVGIMVNLQDYTIGADKGGDVSLFDDFDIDYNQHKYLIESRLSGALTRPKSALVVKAVAKSSTLVTPEAPTWDPEDKTVTVPTVEGVVYKNKKTNATLTTASPVTLNVGEELHVIALPASSSYYLASTAEDEFLFDYEDGMLGGAF
ncbi:head maturation protease [Rhodococcus phage ReqiPepy6]|uniref:Prohead protease n=1 Tax=Rhodococcus phage ReqiPepy6 TaxID=691965 RepID=D4P7D6_9CAUD|nr:head maturation protease [Rhodococcus phage ReqiPepy6]ADD80916.1 prohead protease [Rhodococcus phage ReqiPepy6]